MRRIGIIGGGASGMAAAITAARTDRNADVFILEHNDIVGKKILSTGNGRCNLTNAAMDAGCFRGGSTEFAAAVLENFGTAQTLFFFGSLGLLVKARDGYYYPRSAQASTVREVLVMELRRLGVDIHTDVHVTGLQKTAAGYEITAGEERFAADAVILAAGGKAAPILGADGSGYTLAQSVGHTVTPVVPALVQLTVKDHPLSGAAGVRTDAAVALQIDGVDVAEDTGELQITEYGISGIPVFQVSRFASMGLYAEKAVQAVVDFLPEMTPKEADATIRSYFAMRKEERADAALTGIFPKKLTAALLGCASIRKKTLAKDLTEQQISALIACCKGTRLDIDGTKGFDYAQVCAGGVSTKEVDPYSMESLRAHGLYITGELLDVDGICGGFNISFAFATGCIAGTHAAKDGLA